MNTPKKVLALFHWAARTIPAYKHFLKKHKIHPAHITTEQDFKNVPIMEKENYLRAYPYADLLPQRRIPPFLSMSSGSSGKPFYWSRGLEQERRGGHIHEIIFRDIFKIKKSDRTLVIVGFSMGTWIAGMFTVNSCRAMVEKGYCLTVASPGIEKEDILAILKDFAPNFDTVILTGYPPFLMDVLVEAEHRKINLKRLRLKLLLAGENFSEKWRAVIHALAGIKNTIGGSISVYGSADADVLGHETPLSIFIRQKAASNPKFAAALWGNVGFVPTLVQYQPKEKFFELVKRELVFSAQSGIPLIRYNIHDRGMIIPYTRVKKVLTQFGLLHEAKRRGLLRWQMPFITLAGRNDVAVTFYGLNIYPENIKAGLEDAAVAKYLTGKFITFTKSTGGEKRQTLVIKVELRRNIKQNKKIDREVQKSIFKNFLALNIEYRKLAASIGSRALPTIITISHGDPIFQVRKAKHTWIKKS